MTSSKVLGWLVEVVGKNSVIFTKSGSSLVSENNRLVIYETRFFNEFTINASFAYATMKQNIQQTLHPKSNAQGLNFIIMVSLFSFSCVFLYPFCSSYLISCLIRIVMWRNCL